MEMKTRLEKFAQLAVKVGVNVQKGQLLMINAPVDAKEFVRLLVKAAYEAGASDVMVRWSDAIVNKEWYLHVEEAELENVKSWVIDQLKYVVDKGGCVISVSSPNPGVLKDVPGQRLQKASLAASKATKFYSEHMMANKAQWLVISAPNEDWAKKVYPDMEAGAAVEKLWDAILTASRVLETNDPIEEWNNHMAKMARNNAILNGHRFKTLHFKNGLGTDLSIQLAEDHIWAGGGEHSEKGIEFAPNIPTEEAFTIAYKYGVNGKVVSTKPLNYQGKLIEDFYLVFKDGKVVEFDAKKEKEALANLLDTDEGSRYLGEVALVEHDSPISSTGILFYNTLFDENASCHLALGASYSMNLKGGTAMTKEELEKRGANQSLVHVDFMFGSHDMEIVGEKANGEKVTIFKNGNFAF